MSHELLNEYPEMLRESLISFDIDGVTVDTAPLAVQKFNSLYGTDKTIHDITDFHMLSLWLKQIRNGISEEDVFKRTYDIWNDETVLANALPLPGAMTVFVQLQRLGMRPFFITSRPGETKDVTFKWFEKWLPWVQQDKILMQSSGGVLGRSFKTEEIGKRGIAYHFEDAPEHANAILERTDATVVLIDQPWNQRVEVNERILVSRNRRSYRNVLSSYHDLLNRLRVAQS